jgi:short-subunit dehydrogenase
LFPLSVLLAVSLIIGASGGVGKMAATDFDRKG